MNRQSIRYPNYWLRRLSRRIIPITGGALLQGYAMAVFLFPHSIPSGGGAGIAVLLNYWIQLPMSFGFWAVNISFLLFAVKYLGLFSTAGTVYVITATSVSVKYFELYLGSPFSNIWLDLLIGSMFLGTGVSLLLRSGVSNGGLGFLALAIAKSRKMNPGTVLLWLNILIFSVAAYVIDWKIIILALICQWISTRIITWVYKLPVRRRSLAYTLGWRKK
ncbi:YitT family protein [Paenibacillus pinistramenti]|uniref:YitT family protein n=1 Tax=Paenibacillus pinistramenti TaxID=1768003 RepID=UPI001EF00E99|nr:YitT family protein [Paenibacillus pinistramenti]